jgi:hypothetical protein
MAWGACAEPTVVAPRRPSPCRPGRSPSTRPSSPRHSCQPASLITQMTSTESAGRSRRPVGPVGPAGPVAPVAPAVPCGPACLRPTRSVGPGSPIALGRPVGRLRPVGGGAVAPVSRSVWLRPARRWRRRCPRRARCSAPGACPAADTHRSGPGLWAGQLSACRSGTWAPPPVSTCRAGSPSTCNRSDQWRRPRRWPVAVAPSAPAVAPGSCRASRSAGRWLLPGLAHRRPWVLRTGRALARCPSGQPVQSVR